MFPQYNELQEEALVDYLTCGGCAREFPLKNITNFIKHKQRDCIDASEDIAKQAECDGVLSCLSCSRDFRTARGLLQHVQQNHNLRIYFQRNMPSGDSSTSPTSCNTSSQGVQDATFEHCERPTVEVNHENGKIKSSISATCARLAKLGGTTICCNNRECCVTIVPGTHERPRKCCTSVLPKKRKCHMEKHMGDECDPEGPDEDAEKENCDENFNDCDNEDADERDNEIYIDFRPRNDQSGQDRWIDDQVSPTPSDKNTSYANTGSVMPPAMTFSIPVSYYSSPVNQPTATEFYDFQRTGEDPFVAYSIPQSTTLTVGSSKIMTVSSSIGAFVVDSKQNTMQVLGQDRGEMSSHSPSSVSHHSAQEQVTDLTASSELLVDEEEDEEEEEQGEQKDGDETMDENSAGKGLGKKRRYPTSRPFRCDKCDHAFNQRIHLKKHMSKHTGVKPFKCQQCDYSTVERSHLKVHIRIHTGEKPYKCTFCEYATAQNSTLKIHLKRHHGGKMFECPLCKKKFTQVNMLQSHQEEHLQLSRIGESVSENQGLGEPIKENQGFGEPIRENAGLGEAIRENRGIGEPIRENAGLGEPIRENRGIGEPIRDNRGIGVPIRENLGLGEPIRENLGLGNPISGVHNAARSQLQFQTSNEIDGGNINTVMNIS